MSLSLDNCSHCACSTALSGYDVASAIEDLERRYLGCANCEDDPSPDGHTNCVQLLSDDGTVLWDGRCDKKEKP